MSAPRTGGKMVREFSGKATHMALALGHAGKQVSRNS